jgi:hypothetical protein
MAYLQGAVSEHGAKGHKMAAVAYRAIEAWKSVSCYGVGTMDWSVTKTLFTQPSS